jgi:O-antigen/teichoic acid export membrane protein
MSSPSESVAFDRRLYIVNTASSVLSLTIAIVLMVWVNQYLLTRLPPEEYAPYPLVYALLVVLQILDGFFVFGIGRFVTEEYAKGNRRQVTVLASSMFVLCAIGAALFMLVGGVIAYHIDLVLDLEPEQVAQTRMMFALLVFNQCATMLLAPLSVGMFVLQRFVLLNVIHLVREIMRAALVVGFLFLLGPSVAWLVIATVIATMVAIAWKLFASLRMMPELRFSWSAVSLRELRGVAGYGVWAVIGNAVSSFAGMFDALLLNRASTAFEVNANHIGTMPRRQLDQLYSMGAHNLQPSLIGMHARSEEDVIGETFVRGTRYYLWISLALNAPLIAFSDELIRLYLGEPFIPVGAVLAVHCTVASLVYSTGLLYSVAYARGRIAEIFTLAIAGTALHVVLATLLVWKLGLGALGTAFASLLATCLTQPLVWRLAMRLVGIRFGRYARQALLPGYLPFVAGLAAGLAYLQVVGIASWTAFLGGCLACALAYLAVLRACLRPEDHSEIRLAAGKVRSYFQGREAA